MMRVLVVSPLGFLVQTWCKFTEIPVAFFANLAKKSNYLSSISSNALTRVRPETEIEPFGTGMTENLKTLRFLHDLLLLTATAILAFVLAPDDSTKCKTALDELTALSELRGEDYNNFIEQQLRTLEDNQSEQLIGILRNANIPVLGHPRMPLSWVGELYPSTDSTTPLKTVDAFLSRSHEISPIVLNLDSTTAKTIRTALMKKNRRPQLAIVSFVFGVATWVTDPGGGAYPDNGTLGTQQKQTSFLGNQYGPPLITPHYPVFGQLAFRFQSEPPLSAVTIPMTVFVERTETRTWAIDWLRQDPIGKHLVDGKSGTVFPHVKEFWTYVADMRPEVAASFLKQRLESLRGGTISFFGISVASSVVIWIGPTVSLFICLTLLVNLKQFCAHAKLAEPNAIDYPWFPVFSGRLAGVLTYASLSYPFVCNLWLLGKYGRFDDRNVYVGLVAMTALTVALFAVIRTVRDIRRQIRDAKLSIR